MAAQSGADKRETTKQATFDDCASAHCHSVSDAASCTTASVANAAQHPQAANGSLLARWFGTPFMPCFLGLAALRVWLQVNQFGGYAQSDNGVITILSNLTYGLTFLIAAAIAWRKPPTPRTEHVIALAAVALMLAAPVLMLTGRSLDDSAIISGGALLVGVAGAFGGGMWACAYTRLPLKPALMYAFASLALGSLGGLAASTLPEASRYIASLFMPAIALLCYERTRTYTGDIPLDSSIAGNAGTQASTARAAQRNEGGASIAPTALEVGGIDHGQVLGSSASLADGNTPASHRATGNASPMRFGKAAERPYDNEPKSSLALIIGGIAVFGLALGLSRGFPAGSPVPFELPVRFVHQLGVVAISAGFMWWIGAKGRRISFSLLWRLEIIIAATGAFILMALPGTATEIAVAIVNIADSLMLCVLFITAQDVARHSSLHPFVIFGGAWAARVLSRDFGRTVVFALSPMTQSESAVLGCIVFALSLSMVFLLSDNLPRSRKLFTYDDATPTQTAAARVSATQDVALRAPAIPASAAQVAAAQTATTQNCAAEAAAAQTSTMQVVAEQDAAAQTLATRTELVADNRTAAKTASPISENAAVTPASPTAAIRNPQSAKPASSISPVAERETAASAESAPSDPDAEVREWLRAEYGLTAREIDVALLIAHGRSKTFIADTLFISENTVRTHSKNAYTKLGIHSREELISLFENRTRA